jgi:hypothetical protein
MQVIDTFHDFWLLERGVLEDLAKTNPLIENIIKWLLINYCVYALDITPTRPLLQVAPTNNFNFKTYTTKIKSGDLLYESKLTLSNIESTGRNYVKIPEAVTWGRTGNLHANFISLCEALFPGTDPRQSTMYIVCDAGPANFRNFGIESVAAAIKTEAAAAVAAAKAAADAAFAANPADPAVAAAKAAADAAAAAKAAADADPNVADLAALTLTARISARVSIAGAIAALAQAMLIAGGVDAIKAHITLKIVEAAKDALDKIYDSTTGAKSIKAISSKKTKELCNVIGLIYIAPVIIVNAAAVATASAAAGAAAVVSNANDAADTIQRAIETSLRPAVAYNQLPPYIAGSAIQTLYQEIKVGADGAVTDRFDVTSKALLDTYVPANMFEIILSATTLITATILEMAVASGVADTLQQIMAVTTAATQRSANAYNIGPFVKEISTPQRTADSANSNPKPSTIPGDVYPIIYEFVAQQPQTALPNPFPESDPAAPLAAANVFYSDSNLYTHGRYEIRYERHNWSPITGDNFKYVIGDIRAAPSPNPRYEIEFGDATIGNTYATSGPSAALLSACCLERVLRPPPAALPAPLPPISYDIINQSLNHLVQGVPRDTVLGMITPRLQTVAIGNFSKVTTMFHPYIHFKGSGAAGPDQFHQLPPELWFDIKRGGDRDQVMAAYQLSLLQEGGQLKYPNVVFVTGDQLCGAIAVKKGLATAFKVSSDIRYWPKGVVYADPPPVAFNQQFAEVKPGWLMYDQEPATAPGGPLSSIQSWGGNQMKGGEFTIITYDTIQDGYGNTYNLEELNNFVLKLKTSVQQNPQYQQQLQQLQQQLQQQQLQQQHQEQYQQLQRQYLLQLLQQPQIVAELIHLLQQQPPQLLQLSQEQIQLLQQPQPPLLQQLLQQLNPQQLLEKLQHIYIIKNNPESYALILNIPVNLQKLLLMNFGTQVDIGKILYAFVALPNSVTIRTRDGLIAYLNEHNIINYVNTNPQIIHGINDAFRQVQEDSTKAAGARDAIFAHVRAQAEQTALAQAPAAAQAQDVPEWVNDMFAILRFTTVPNKIEYDPSVPVEAANAPMNGAEEYIANYAAVQFAVAKVGAQRGKRTATQEATRGGKQGGQQSDVEEEKKKQLEEIIESTFESINEGRDNKMTLDKNHPMYKSIEEIVEMYVELPNLASKIAFFTKFCNMRTNEEIISAIKQSKVNVGSVAKAPAPVANATPTKPKFTLKPPPPKGRFMNFSTFIKQNKAKASQPTTNANTSQPTTNFIPISARPQTISATTGTVTTSASKGRRGGKRRTHKKCHTKKTRRTQKNHKRKKHGTQRK